MQEPFESGAGAGSAGGASAGAGGGAGSGAGWGREGGWGFIGVRAHVVTVRVGGRFARSAEDAGFAVEVQEEREQGRDYDVGAVRGWEVGEGVGVDDEGFGGEGEGEDGVGGGMCGRRLEDADADGGVDLDREGSVGRRALVLGFVGAGCVHWEGYVVALALLAPEDRRGCTLMCFCYRLALEICSLGTPESVSDCQRRSLVDGLNL